MDVGIRFSMGLDFGSASVRCIIVDCADGSEIGSAVWAYASGEDGVYGDVANPHVARQNPRDFYDGIVEVVPKAIRLAHETCADFSVDKLCGIGVDATSATVLPVDKNLEPLSWQPAFAGNLDAMAWMWKDHTAWQEADEITALAEKIRPQYLLKCGGSCSSEWYFSKILHCLRVSPDVFASAWTWLDLPDFIPAMLCGITSVEALRPGVCAAGHKALYSDEWGGYPDEEFLTTLAPELGELRKRLPARAYSCDHAAGSLSAAWGERLGLPAGIPVAVGGIDAHLGAVGAGVGVGRMAKIVGTSACDIIVSGIGQRLPDIPGVCGSVQGSVLPGAVGIEAGQVAVGDIFNWFVSRVCKGDASLHGELTAEAAQQRPGKSGLLSLDWENGNRNILKDERLTGLIVGLTLHTSQAEIYRALIEGTAFGARRILDRLEEYGLSIDEVVACGGIAEKNPMFMQIYADVLGRTMLVSASAQTCALGAAIMGMVAGGVYEDVPAAQAAVCQFKDIRYEPKAENREIYERLYALYLELHDSFGRSGSSVDHYHVMKELLAIASE